MVDAWPLAPGNALHALRLPIQGGEFATLERRNHREAMTGGSLGAIPWRKSVEIAAAIADGLTAAHAKGIIHRDLKPEDIFLTENDLVKVLDFGLARFEPPASASGDTPTGSFYAAATEAGAILGTVGYMSPEQVRAQGVDARSDVFSLGCVLFEMVEGERAFAGESAMDTLAAILNDDPPELMDSGRNIPLELSRLIQHCLEKRRETRCQSARDVALALRAILSDSNHSRSPAVTAGGVRISVVFWLLSACAPLSVAAMAAFPIIRSFRNGPASSHASPTGLAFGSLAILPLDNVTGSLQEEPLCEGLAEHLSGRLSQVHGLKVRPISSTVHYRGQKAMPRLSELSWTSTRSSPADCGRRARPSSSRWSLSMHATIVSFGVNSTRAIGGKYFSAMHTRWRDKSQQPKKYWTN